MFLLDNTLLSNEDIKLHNLTFTWYNKIQLIFNAAQIKLLNEKETWINKLIDRRGRINLKLNENYQKVKEIKTKDKISDAEHIVNFLKKISLELAEITKEV